jgi:hypothetical protein
MVVLKSKPTSKPVLPVQIFVINAALHIKIFVRNSVTTMALTNVLVRGHVVVLIDLVFSVEKNALTYGQSVFYSIGGYQ